MIAHLGIPAIVTCTIRKKKLTTAPARCSRQRRQDPRDSAGQNARDSAGKMLTTVPAKVRSRSRSPRGLGATVAIVREVLRCPLHEMKQQIPDRQFSTLGWVRATTIMHRSPAAMASLVESAREGNEEALATLV